MSEIQNPEKRKWRKKRKTVLSNAKKYQKKGQLGRGAKLSDENYQYFMNILEVMQKGVPSEEERQILVNNVLERTVGEELNISCNQLGCRLVEQLLPYAQPSDLERFMTALSPDLRKLCSDNFSSHVIEKLLNVACLRAVQHLQEKENDCNADDKSSKKRKTSEPDGKSTFEYPDDHIEFCHNFTLKVCRYALNNLEEFIWNSYANHILRTAIKCTGGVRNIPEKTAKKNTFKDGLALATDTDKGSNQNQQTSNELKYGLVPEEYKLLVIEYVNRLLQWPQFNDLPYQTLTSGLLQVLLYAVNNVDKKLTKTLLKKLLNESFTRSNADIDFSDAKTESKDPNVSLETLPRVFKSDPSLRLLEVTLAVARSKLYTQIYAKCFINRLAVLAVMPGVNFTVQRLFDNCNLKEEFEPMFEEIGEKFHNILFCGNTGVLVALAKACLRLKSKQAQFITSLESALKCSEPDQQRHFAVLCARLLPLDRVKAADHSKEYFVNVHGSVLVQTILEFNRPTKIVSSLLEMTTEELVVLFKDAKGCRIADTFCEGQFVGIKARDKIIWKMKGTYADLALSKYGSRAMEAIFKSALFDQKCKIMDELMAKGQLILGTPFGRLIFNKLNVDSFKKSKEQWKAQMIKAGMFKDDPVDRSKDKKKKRKFRENQ